jgi:DNA-binding NtrC family response regulator
VSDDATVPSQRFDGLPVEALEITVRHGPDAGRTISIEKEDFSIGTIESNDFVLTDPTVSRFHAELRRVTGGLRIKDCGSTNGLVINGVEVRGTEVGAQPPFTLRLGHSELSITRGGTRFAPPLPRETVGRLVGASDPMLRLYDTIRRLASHDSNVLIHGESGTGKELVAEAIVASSRRARGPFVTVDCGALPAHLVLSELFGHERGAFTSADRRHIGAFERAHGGTLFLDEIGELPSNLQPTLLGVLERKRLRRVGGTVDIPSDVRVLCATHRDLRGSVNDGSFRLDLYHRLAIVNLHVPPLRERFEDLDLLIEHFLIELGVEARPEALSTPEGRAALLRHDWPGNVRELRNYVESATALEGAASLGGTVTIGGEAAGARVPPAPSDPGAIVPFRAAKAAATAEFERRYLERLWAAAGGDGIRAAARLAQMDRSYLSELLRRHGIARPGDGSGS